MKFYVGDKLVQDANVNWPMSWGTYLCGTIGETLIPEETPMVYEGDSAGHAFWMSNVNRWCYMPVYANGGYSMMNYIGMTIGKDVVKVVGFMDVLREAGATMDHLLMDCTIPDYDHFDYTLKGIKGDIRVIDTHTSRETSTKPTKIAYKGKNIRYFKKVTEFSW